MEVVGEQITSFFSVNCNKQRKKDNDKSFRFGWKLVKKIKMFDSFLN
jgi:hypothetical protein